MGPESQDNAAGDGWPYEGRPVSPFAMSSSPTVVTPGAPPATPTYSAWVASPSTWQANGQAPVQPPLTRPVALGQSGVADGPAAQRGRRGRAQPPALSRRVAFGRRGAWERPALLLAGLALGLAGLVAGGLGVAAQFLPRTFTASQRAQIMAWEVANRWRAWPAGQVFPSKLPYSLSGAAFGGGIGLNLTAHRVGITRRTSCQGVADAWLTQQLSTQGCRAVLRATYEDATEELATTVAVAVLDKPGGEGVVLRALSGRRSAVTVRPVPFRRTVVARFVGTGQRLPWDHVAGPYLVLATVGYADGRPWVGTADDSYTRAEMQGLVSGVAQDVASHLGDPPPLPHCPGSPGC